MRIHHLNCATDCPLGGALFDGRSIGPLGRLACHCLLIETDAHGLVLVDTGYGLGDVAHPHRHPVPTSGCTSGTPPSGRSKGLATARGDARHIVATQLDFDHAGGLEDFPNAAVHVMQRE